MIEIRNKSAGPVQIVVRSFSDRREHAREMTVLNIPGKKTFEISEERVVPGELERKKKMGLINFRTIKNK